MTQINLDFFAALSKTPSNTSAPSGKPGSSGNGAFRGVMGKKLATNPDAGKYGSGKDKGSGIQPQNFQAGPSVEVKDSANNATTTTLPVRKHAVKNAAGPAQEAMADELEMAILQSALAQKWAPAQEEFVFSTTDSVIPENVQEQPAIQLLLPLDAGLVSKNVSSGVLAQTTFAQISANFTQSGAQQIEEDAEIETSATFGISKNDPASAAQPSTIVGGPSVVAEAAMPETKTGMLQSLSEAVDEPSAHAQGNAQVGFQDLLDRKMTEAEPVLDKPNIFAQDVAEKTESTFVRENMVALQSQESRIAPEQQAGQAEAPANASFKPSAAAEQIPSAQSSAVPHHTTAPLQINDEEQSSENFASSNAQEYMRTASALMPDAKPETPGSDIPDKDAVTTAPGNENTRVLGAIEPASTATLANSLHKSVFSAPVAHVIDSNLGKDNAQILSPADNGFEESQEAELIGRVVEKSMEKIAAKPETPGTVQQLTQQGDPAESKDQGAHLEAQAAQNAEPAHVVKISTEKAAFSAREVSVPERAESADLPGAREMHLDSSQNFSQATRSFAQMAESAGPQTTEKAMRAFEAVFDEAATVEQGEVAMAAMPKPASIASEFAKNRERILHKVARNQNSSLEQPAIKATAQTVVLPAKPTAVQPQNIATEQDAASGAIEDALTKRASMNHGKVADMDLKNGIHFDSEHAPSLSAPPMIASEAAMRARAAERVERLHELAARLDEHVLAMMRGKNNTMTVSLSPPNLGRVALSCREEAGAIRVQIAVENESVRSMLQQQERQLREMLEQSGYRLAQFDVKSEGHGPQHDGRRKHNAAQDRRRVETVEDKVEESLPAVAQGMLGKDSVWFIA